MNRLVTVLIMLFLPATSGAFEKVITIDQNTNKGILISSKKIRDLGYAPENFNVSVMLDGSENKRGNPSGKVRIEIRLDRDMKILSYNFVR